MRKAISENYTELRKKLLKELNTYRSTNDDAIFAYKQQNKDADEDDIELQRLREIKHGINLFIYFAEFNLVNETIPKRTEMLMQKDRNFSKKHPIVLNFLIDKGIFDTVCYIKYINRLYNREL